MNNLIVCAAASVFVALAFCTSTPAVEPIEVFRTGDELIVRLDRFDLLRQANPSLRADLKLRGNGKENDIAIDLADTAANGTLVIDLSKFGDCTGMSITVNDAAGKWPDSKDREQGKPFVRVIKDFIPATTAR